MKQKLSLARALLHDPEILILDEPVSSLDPHGIKEVRDILLEENANGKTIFISSHILSEIERICHRVGIIHHGQLLAEDTMDELKRRLTEEVELEIELESPLPEAEELLSRLPFVTAFRVEDRRIALSTRADGDYRAQVSKALSEAGAVLLGMKRHEMSLEDAF